MTRKILIAFSAVIFILAVSILSASEQKRLPTLTERAKKAWIREHQPPDSTELALRDRMKWRRVLRVTKNYGRAVHGESTYDRIKNLDLESQTDQHIFDSLLNDFLTEIDLLYNPDTPENEFRDEMLRRIKYCDDRHFERWWNSSDLRADIVIQQGIDWLIYVPPSQAKCPGGILKRFEAKACCYHCQLSYPNQGIFLQLEGRTEDCFTKVVIWDSQGCQGMFQPNEEEKRIKLSWVQEVFRKEIAERPTPPAYKPFKSAKNLKMALRIMRRPLGDDTYEIWAIFASPLDQFTQDSLKRVNFSIHQVIWSLKDVPEIYGRVSIEEISMKIDSTEKDGFYFSAIKSILPSGKWKFVLTPLECSEDTNKTIFSTDIEIPGGSGASDLSDIMLYLDEMHGKVKINGKSYLGLPFSSYKSEHTLNAMISSCNTHRKGTSLIAWYLRPIKEKEYIIRGKPSVEEDSAKWVKWPEGSIDFDTTLFPVRNFLEKEDIILVCKEISTRQIFELHQSLADIPHGNYELRFLIMDPRLKDNKVRESMTTISIK